MTKSSFIVINATYNHAHSKSVLLISSLSVLIVLLYAAIFAVVHTDGRSKASFEF